MYRRTEKLYQYPHINHPLTPYRSSATLHIWRADQIYPLKDISNNLADVYPLQY